MHDNDGSVRELQRYIRILALERGDIPTIAVDGFYDDVTADAVRAVQRSFGLPVTGVTDFATWNTARDESAAVTARRSPARQAGRFSPPALVLGEGDSGDVVLMLQLMLAAISSRFGHLPDLRTSGIYDAATGAAVAEFQRSTDLPVSSLTDKDTWDAIADTYNSVI